MKKKESDSVKFVPFQPDILSKEEFDKRFPYRAETKRLIEQERKKKAKKAAEK